MKADDEYVQLPAECTAKEPEQEQTLVQLHVNISNTHLMMPMHIARVALYSTDCDTYNHD